MLSDFQNGLGLFLTYQPLYTFVCRDGGVDIHTPEHMWPPEVNFVELPLSFHHACPT